LAHQKSLGRLTAAFTRRSERLFLIPACNVFELAALA
jgi:hypothetical protein